MYRSWTSHKSTRARLGKNTNRLSKGTLRLLGKAPQSSRIQGWISNRRLPRGATWRYWDHVAVELNSLLVLALGGTAAIDAKRRRSFGEQWMQFAAVTSNVPFAAIVAGKNRL